jgi:protein-tyrosine phosphatase
MSKITTGLFIGNRSNALHSEFFRKNNIDYVLNCTSDVPFINLPNAHITFRRFSVEDHGRYEDITTMTENLPFLVKELETAYKKGKNILIHCHAGVQRSATVMTAFLMYTNNFNLETATNMLLKYHPIAFSFGKQNNFKESLINFEKYLINCPK